MSILKKGAGNSRIWLEILLSVITLGAFQIYWQFRLWKDVKAIQKSDISPAWRTAGDFVPILNLFLLYSLYNRIFKLTQEKGTRGYNPWLLLLGIPILAAIPFAVGSIIPPESSSNLLVITLSLMGMLFLVIPFGLAQLEINTLRKNITSSETPKWTEAEKVLCVIFVLAMLAPVNPFILGIRKVLVTPYQVEGNAMANTLLHGDYVLSNNSTYGIGSPQRGDIVVLRPPHNPDNPYIKRIVGLPSETIIIRDGNVFIRKSGKEEMLEEPYLGANSIGKTYQAPPSSGNTSSIEYLIPEMHYFVLGDNRMGSLDSRSFRSPNGEDAPFVHVDDIRGKVFSILLPVNRMQLLKDK
ncbi:MAG: signal peptidase I [bacterium]|nr:signal peptidase I [bacterium]